MSVPVSCGSRAQTPPSQEIGCVLSQQSLNPHRTAVQVQIRLYDVRYFHWLVTLIDCICAGHEEDLDSWEPLLLLASSKI